MWTRWRQYQTNRQEIEAEIDSFLAEKAEVLMREGLSPEEARDRARREFGNVTLTKELSREEWSWKPLEQSLYALRYAFRALRRNPGFALTVLLTLSVGIGASSAIFNLLHAVLLRSLPVPEAQQLRLLSATNGGQEDTRIFSYPVLMQMQEAVQKKASLAGYSSLASTRINLGKDTERASTQLVSGNFFSTLGVAAQIGRLLGAQDDVISGSYAVVISGDYWSRRFGRDPGVIGRTLNLNNVPVTIVGVTPDHFFGVLPGRRPDFWISVAAQQELGYRQNFWNSNGDDNKPFIKQTQIRWLSLLARIKEGDAEGWITAAINQVHKQDMQQEARGREDTDQVKNLLHTRVRLDAGDKGLGDIRQRLAAPLLVLMGAVGLVLAMACLNLASLSLARATARRKEIAVRCSLGASRTVIAGHFIAETILLSVAGGLLAIPVALGASRLLLRWASNGNPMPMELGLSVPVLLFTGLAAFLAGSAFGLAPAYYACRVELSEAMKAQSTSVKGSPLPWGRTLIATEVAFSAILLTGAVLFLRTFLNYSEIALGFAPEPVLTVSVDPMGARMTTEQLLPVYQRILSQVNQLPGVQSAAFASCGLAQGCKSVSGVSLPENPKEDKSLQENTVTPDYFATVGMPLLSGRFFTSYDTGKKPVWAVINATAAKRYFGGSNPIGRHFGYGGDLGKFEVIGVVADARVNDQHEEARPMAYYSLLQMPAYANSLEVRMRGEPEKGAAAIRSAIRQTAPFLPVVRTSRLTEHVQSNLLRERLLARLASAFAGLALGLACLGVYGLFSYTTARRTSEIGIRLALGAQSSTVRWMVLREALALVGVGLAVGIPLAIAAMGLVRGLLYGVSAGDPGSVLAGVLVLLVAGLLAAVFPAWKASRVDPVIALRSE